jgi:uncharacterized protein YerC
MSKSIKKQRTKEKELAEEALYTAARRMGGTEPVVAFIDSLLTESERNIIGRRILISQMILAGKSQAEIRYNLSVSPNTFSRTRKWLSLQIPNYDTALKDYEAVQKLKRKSKTQEYTQYDDTYSFKAFRKKYPGHFLLFNIAHELFKRS